MADTFTMEVGGKGLNLALGAYRLGARVSGILPLGNDLFGRIAESTLEASGLSSAVFLRLAGQTGSGIGFADRNGDNCLAVFPGANGRLSAADLRSKAAEVASADLVVAQFEIPDEPILEAFTIARGAGRRTLLTPSPFRRIDPRILACTSILVLNRVEACQLAAQVGVDQADASDLSPAAAQNIAAALHAEGVETVVVTLGADGALAYRAGCSPLRQPAFAVTAVDTLGAGDAFTAGFAVSLMEHQEFAACLRRGAACAAITVQQTGVFAVLPTRDDIESFLAAQPALRSE